MTILFIVITMFNKMFIACIRCNVCICRRSM